MNVLGRRQRQARMGYTHLAQKQRPGFKKRSTEVSDRREAVAREVRTRMQQGTGKK